MNPRSFNMKEVRLSKKIFEASTVSYSVLIASLCMVGMLLFPLFTMNYFRVGFILSKASTTTPYSLISIITGFGL